MWNQWIEEPLMELYEKSGYKYERTPKQESLQKSVWKAVCSHFLITVQNLQMHSITNCGNVIIAEAHLPKRVINLNQRKQVKSCKC